MRNAGTWLVAALFAASAIGTSVVGIGAIASPAAAQIEPCEGECDPGDPGGGGGGVHTCTVDYYCAHCSAVGESACVESTWSACIEYWPWPFQDAC